jgi:nitrogen-specific signal transduction histidine kinase/ActR/RegA family two-component response regulator
MTSKNSNKTEIEISHAPFVYEGRPAEIISVRDLSERKELENQLQQAQKMEAIGTLGGGIAHDFNNLLTGVQGNVSLMLMDTDSTHPYYERLKNIEKQVQSGARLTSYLLGYARKGKYEIKPVHLNQLVEETSKAFGRTKKEITIHGDFVKDLSAIEGDPGQIDQVLWNLLVNAADAMPRGGDLILKTTNVTHQDMKGKLYDPKPGNYVLLTVTDTGIGMDKETMERIFDPFFTTKEMGRGTGLGLASAYGIIRGHGGHIDVESKKGQGTTFSIYLPASEKKVQKAVETGYEIIKGTGTVLLVDDEEVVLEVGQDMLEAMGYRVRTARDGKEAIEVYRKNQDDIDFVLLDMIMPDMGGGEAYDKMKEINPDVEVLLSSGYSIDGQAKEILKRGCDAFIQKPFSMKELSGKIREVQNKR